MQQQDFSLKVEPMKEQKKIGKKSPSPRPLAEVQARIKSFREPKQTWVPEENRIEKKTKPNLTQPEYYSGGKRMSPVKLMYSIKQRIDAQVDEGMIQRPKNN